MAAKTSTQAIAARKAAYIQDLLDVMQAPEGAPITNRIKAGLLVLPLSTIEDLHDLLVYCETH